MNARGVVAVGLGLALLSTVLVGEGEGRAAGFIPAVRTAGTSPAAQPEKEGERKLEWVLFRTDAGDIEVALDASRAPLTVANFLRYVEGGHYSGGEFHRTVREDNQPTGKVKIGVVQAGRNPKSDRPEFAAIPLERTNKTGLRHVDGAVSMARDGPDTATSDIFICVGAQPALDFGGKRNPDGQGFAAFGRVVRGMDVVRKIQAGKAEGQKLTPPVRIRAAERLAPPPALIGHRGLLREAPENTLTGFTACLDLGLGFEFDVRRTKDGELVVVHDVDLKRTTTGQGKVSDHTLAELRALDAGSWFDPAFAGEKVPTLDEVFALVKTRGKANTVVAVDIKIDDDQVEGDIVRLAKKHGVLAKIVCIGTAIDSATVRQRLHKADPATPSAVLANVPATFAEALADKGARWVYVRFVPTAEQVKKAHAAGKKVIVVGPTVMGREPANWLKAREAGVDAILTDFPLDCRRRLRDSEP